MDSTTLILLFLGDRPIFLASVNYKLCIAFSELVDASTNPPKSEHSEKSSSLKTIPSGKQAIGTRLSVEFYNDCTI